MYWTADDGESHRRRIEVCSSSPSTMEILLNQHLPVGLKVNVARGSGAPIPGKVQHCTEEPDGYCIELFILRPERRRFEHKPEQQPATLQWSNASGKEISSEVVVRNSTEEGVQVELADNVPVPSVVRLCRADWRELGLTCYCNPTGDKYRVGIEFTHAPYHKDAAEPKD